MLRDVCVMSPSQADSTRPSRHVRFVPKGDDRLAGDAKIARYGRRHAGTCFSCAINGANAFTARYSGVAPTGGRPGGRCRKVIEAKAPIQEPAAAKITYAQLSV
jgi:hypothetical protein